jgi:hypothetical protein
MRWSKLAVVSSRDDLFPQQWLKVAYLVSNLDLMDHKDVFAIGR